MITVLIIGAIAFSAGIGISWVFYKPKLDLIEETNGSLVLNIKDKTEKFEAAQELLGDYNVKNGSLTKELELKDLSIEDYKAQLKTKTTEIIEKQELLTIALEAKTTAETTLADSRKHVGELLKKEYFITQEIKDLQEKLIKIEKENVALKSNQEATVKSLEDQQKFVETAQKNLKDAFGALSATALQHNNTSFVELAKAKLEEKVTEAKGEFEKKQQAIGELVKPLGESLKNMDSKIQDLEGKRIKAYGDIWNYLDQVKLTTEGLKKETTNLVGALKTSHTRGRYGEIGLKRLVEHAGMFENCHFEEQVSVEGNEGTLRPDMIIKLPGEKILVVDSKAPLSAYMRMHETDDADQQKLLLNQHILAIKDHLKKLSARDYWKQFKDAPDFVIMYMHIESSYGSALQAWPEMIEEAMKNRIIIATPTVLLSILLGVSYGWNQLKTIDNIEDIRKAAVELHDRSVTLIEHMVEIGKGLNRTVVHYNSAVGSLESKFLPQARIIKNLSQAYTNKTLPDIISTETSIRPVLAIPPTEGS